MLKICLAANARKAVIERDTDLLTPEELVKHKDEVLAAVHAELQTWANFQCFSIKARCDAQGLSSSEDMLTVFA